LTSAIFGTLEVGLLALINPLAAALLAIHTFTIKYTSQAMLERVPAFFSLLAVVAYADSRGRLNAWPWLSAVALGLTAASKYIYCRAGLAVLTDWLFGNSARQSQYRRQGMRQQLPPVAAWCGLDLVSFWAASPYLWNHPLSSLWQSITYHAGCASGFEVETAHLPPWQALARLSESVPWHPGAFVISLDLLITLLAAAGWRRLNKTTAVHAVWLGVGLTFLLIWTTRWPQYVLILTAPLCLAAAKGLAAHVGEPVLPWVHRAQAMRISWACQDYRRTPSARPVVRCPGSRLRLSSYWRSPCSR
jgi:hypothetical protein